MLPPSCLLCGTHATGGLLCHPCAADLPWHDGPQCPICALPTGTGDICGNCLKKPPAFDASLALLEYRFPINAVLQRYKYSGFLAAAHLMGDLLTRKLGDAPLPDLIIPMPLHPGRLKERGFNQAVEIGRVVSKRLNVPLAASLARRTRPTLPQANLPLKERRSNLRGVFAFRERLDGKRIALLDDVMTTGTSLDALALAAKNAGAGHVECWVIARTLPE